MDAQVWTKFTRNVFLLRLLFALFGLMGVAAVTHASTVATPTFSPVAGTYTSAQKVTITTTTGGASIRYTTNGTTPSATAGNLYSGPLTLSSTTTLKAIAYETGFTNSAVATGTYSIKVIAPVFSPAAGTYTSPQSVTITSTTSGASIRYTTDGSTPSATAGTVYSGPVAISTTTTLKAIAYETGLTSSSVTSGTYTIKAVAPVFSPAAGTYTSAQSVMITSANAGASIRYTTDGSTPSATAGNLYAGPLVLGSTTTLKAIAYESGLANSAVTSGTYTINLPTAATPVFSPVAGTYTSVQTVKITTTTSGATIRYTTDGSTPSATAGNLYAGPLALGSTTTLKAITYETGFKNSAVKSGLYTINLPTAAAPIFSPAAGTYASAQSVTITSATSGASIRYTTDGSTPSATAGTLYSGPLALGSTTTLKAIAYKTNFNNSPLTSGTYTITPPPAITSPLTAAAQVGAAFSYQITASNNPTSYNTTGLSPGLSVDTSTGLITGVPTTAATTNITISASNSDGTGSAILVLTVNPEPVTFTVAPTSFTYNGSAQGPMITPSVSGATYSTSGTASATSAGFYTVTATATGNYTGTSGSTSWMIAQATPTITWATPSPIVYGTALDSTALNATANVSGSFAYAPSAGTVPNVGSQTLSATFTPTDTTDYTNASASVSLTVNPEPVTFTISPVSFTYNGSAQGPMITPSVSGATYSISGTASTTAAGSYTVTATATGNYTGTSGPIAWTVNKANAGTPTITASANPSIFSATVTFAPGNGTTGNYVWSINGNAIAAYNGSSWSPVSGTYAAGTWSLSGLNLLVTPTSLANYTVVFSDTGNGNYNPASSATITETVNPPPPLAPVFSPAGGTFTSAPSVTITSSGATSIYYTTDGTTPTTSSTLYAGPVSISSATILCAIGVNAGGSSPVASATYAIDQPPTITPDTPSPTFSSSDDVSLSFDASDAMSGVTSVVLSSTDPNLSDITLTSPTSGSTWTFSEPSTLPPGTYIFIATAYDNNGGKTSSAPVTVTVLPSLPYLTDFESSEGYILGTLNQQLGWSAPQGSALVTNQDAAHGSQSVVLQPSVPPAQVTQVFAPFVPPAGTPNIIFIDFYAKPVAETDVTTATTFNVGSARFAFVLNGGQGMLEAFNGNGSGGGTWSPTSFTVPLAANNQSQNWIHLTARLDFTQGTWDLYANGAMVAASLGFLDSTSTALTTFSVQGDAATASEVDNIFAGTNNPLFADVNNDGIDDAWETAHNLSLSVNDRNLPAANGATVLQDYINGIDPTDYYGGALPVLTSLVDPSGMPGTQGLVSVKVTRASDGTPLVNAPITLAVTTGASTISATTTPGSLTSVNVLTDSNGIASGYVNFISSASDVLVATAQSGAQKTTLSINLVPSIANLGGLRLWLKADAIGSAGPVSIWADQSGNNNNATQASASNQPTLVANALNGRPVVHFDATQRQSFNLPNVMVSTTSSTGEATAGEIFAVVRSAGVGGLWSWGGAYGNLYPYGDGSVYDDFGTNVWTSLGKPALDLTQYSIYNISSSSSEWTQRFNGLVNYDRMGNTVSFRASPSLASNPYAPLTGDMAEIIVYDHVLTPQERDTVCAYLGNKYNLYMPPPVPANLTAVPLSPGQVSLQWSAPARGDHVNYLVERSTNGAPSIQVASVADGMSYIDAGLTPATTYTYQVKAQGYAGTSIPSGTATATTLLSEGGTDMPLTSQNGMRLWLKADAGLSAGSGINLWADQSGNGNNATQASGSQQPTLGANALNGRPVVHFDATNRQSFNLPNVMVSTTSPTGEATAGEIFIVVRSANPGSPAGLGSWGGAAGTFYPYSNGNLFDDFGASVGITAGQPAQDIGQYNLYNVSSSSSEWTQRFNGMVNYDQIGNTVSFRALPTLGSNPSAFLTGDIAEVIVYDHVLTPQERETVGFYLNSKYAFAPRASFDFYRDGNYDGLPDGLDRQLGFDPFSMDVDNDHDTNLQDVLAGLDPLDPLSVPPPPLQPMPGNPPPTITLTEPADAVPLP